MNEPITVELRVLGHSFRLVTTEKEKADLERAALLLNDKYDVLILQIQTGCEGLNLQENYSEIYFVSPHWNPAVEEQAIARCHRIGQKKEVVVNRFEMSGFVGQKLETKTVDNYVGSVQDCKRKIVSEIIAD